jgi:hypothetical protein
MIEDLSTRLAGVAIEIPSEGILDAPGGSSSRAPDARRPRGAPASRRRRADVG